MFGTASKWIGIYNIWYYGVLMALNGNEAIITFHYILLKGKRTGHEFGPSGHLFVRN